MGFGTPTNGNGLATKGTKITKNGENECYGHGKNYR